MLWERRKKREVGERWGASSHYDRKRIKEREKVVLAERQLPVKMAQPSYLGNAKSDSLLRMPDSPILAHFFDNLWCFSILLQIDGNCG